MCVNMSRDEEQSLKDVIFSALSHIPEIRPTKLDEILAVSVFVRDDVWHLRRSHCVHV